MMKDAALRFCVVGTGRAGLIHARNLARHVVGARLESLCDSNESSLRSVSHELEIDHAYTDYREAVTQRRIDAVVVTTPTFLHSQVACAAASAGKHVFLEKPMAVTVDECRAISEAASKSGVLLQIGFMRRFDDGFLRAKETIESGDLGRVMIIKSTGRGPGGPGAWMYDLTKSNGIIAEVNSHDIDSVLWLTGLSIETVYAQGHNFKCQEARQQWPDFYDNVVAHLGLSGGAMGVIDGTCPAHYGYDARVEVMCEKGALFIGDYRDRTATKVTVDGQVVGSAVKTWRTLFKDAYLAEMEHFVDCIVKRRQPRVSGMDGLRAVEAVIAINQSIRSGNVVRLSTRGIA